MTTPFRQRKISAARGLATVALLKVNFDAGHDHIGMFIPFVLDALTEFNSDGFGIQEVRIAVDERSGLAIPANALKTLLSRVVKRGLARREGGRYFLTGKTIEVPDLLQERRRIEERQRTLATQLSQFAKDKGLNLPTTEDALGAILTFIEDNQVALALALPQDKATSRLPESLHPAPHQTRIVAGFLYDQLASGGESAEIIHEMLAGYILQNTLFLRDIAEASRRFTGLEAFLDTRILLGILGFRGVAEEFAAREALSLMREAGATLSTFDPTIRELRRILAVYERNLGTSEGRLSLRPSDVTRYFLTNHFSPSEVAQQSALVERNLKGLGIGIRSLPTHQSRYTLDEPALSEKLASGPGGEDEPRVIHDVECIAAVLTLRAGRHTDTFDTARAVFVTTSGLLVRNSTAWYGEQSGGGVPPVIHHWNLSNLAWLKKPASGLKLKLHELVALCAAALRPPRKVWESFLRHLRNLLASGALTSDEVTAIVASALTDRLLAEEPLEDEVDAETVAEIVDRVKASYSAEADRRVAEAQSTAEATANQALELRTTVERRSRQLARALCSLLAFLLTIALAVGFLATVQAMRTGRPPGLLALVLASALSLAGLLSVLWGFNIRGWRQGLEERLSRRLRLWLAGER